MDQGLERIEGTAAGPRQFRYFDYVMVAFVTILLLSNLIGAGKRAVVDLPLIGLWPFGAGVLFFPVSYVIGGRSTTARLPAPIRLDSSRMVTNATIT